LLLKAKLYKAKLAYNKSKIQISGEKISKVKD